MRQFAGISDEAALDVSLAEAVLRIRISQLLINERLRAKEFRVPVHLALGHEAIAAAVSAAMGEGDLLSLTHRNIHYNLARATEFKAELAELRLSEDGIAGGRLGSMNMINPARGIVYSSSILGNNLCVGAGVALAEAVAATNAVTFIVTGDGAMEEGSFYESLEFLKTAGLMAVVLVENNGWSMFTRIRERRCAIGLKALADCFGIPYEHLAGNDPWRYAETLAALRTKAGTDRSPMLVEVKVDTLGDFTMPADGRHINYHHGVAPVELSDWPLLRDDPSDPVHVLANRLGESAARDIARRVRTALAKEFQ